MSDRGRSSSGRSSSRGDRGRTSGQDRGGNRKSSGGRASSSDRSSRSKRGSDDRRDAGSDKDRRRGRGDDRPSGGDRRPPRGRSPKRAKPSGPSQEPHLREEIRLNKFIAHGGFCSRRDADEWIERGEVKVNGTVVTEHGVKVRTEDRVEVRGQQIRLEPFVYLLLHKSKDTICTTDDEKGRYTVMNAIEKATGARVYPVGRLDRDTTGLLLLTNDGDLAHRLMHPSYNVKKVYEVETDPPLGDAQLQELAQGIELEDGPVTPLKVRRSMTDPSLVEITIHEGRNHLVRRIVDHYGAEVSRLKRVRYAGLNLQDVNMDRWRHLKRSEVNQLRRSVKLEPLHEERERE